MDFRVFVSDQSVCFDVLDREGLGMMHSCLREYATNGGFPLIVGFDVVEI